MALGANEKTEKPTSKRLGESRSKGQVAKSMDINSATALLGGFLILYYVGASTNHQIRELMKTYLSGLSTEPLTQTTLNSIMVDIVGCTTKILLPIIAGLVAIALASAISQVGFVISFQKLKPNLGMLNPIKGFKNILISTRSIVKLLMSFAKLSIVGVVAYYAIMKDLGKFIDISSATLGQIFTTSCNSIFWLAVKISAVLLILALFDYAYQKWQYMKDMMMSKQEVKDENKQSEGDPLVKGKIRAVQRQWAMRRMMSDVPQADVIVTNPIHLAIALKYDSDSMSAPKVVAKGSDLIAKRIVKIAKGNNIPIFEDIPLAHALFKTVEIGYEVPQKLYHAVAKVLSYIYKLRRPSGR